MTPLEAAKARTLKEISGVLRSCYSWRVRNVNINHCQWTIDRHVKNYSGGDQQKAEECKALIEWGYSSPLELEVYMAGRSPSTAAKWSISHSRRLCPDAEKIVKEKAKDRGALLDYCTHFRILLDDMSKITMKAAFDGDSRREKEYIRKMEHTKKRIKEFLEQMTANGQLDSGITVGELIQTL